jgi:hypothetical protein
MAIVSSTYTVGVPQIDGRCYVVELHTDSTGQVHRVEYGPVGVIDYQAVMQARAAQIGNALADAEAESMYGA